MKSLFQLVLEQPVADRPVFLERACGADRQLYNEVRELLRSDSTSDSFLEKPAVTPLSKVLADAAADVNEPMPGQIGPYAVQKILGSGGMGNVYLAQRADKSFNKQVAIKVIHRGMESDRILQRFRRERQIIASLDHPNIARLLDGGATSDGRPYIVMEYVEGMPINHWCDQKRLSTDKRLHIFLQVCDAVQYAHQNLVIHRDIKPGNILVRADNTAKLLDFGIAKLMNSESSMAATEKTATSMRLMTPQYASPEQLKGEQVTTASDVYLLGIVLYELLTGHRPYEVKENAALEALNAYAQGEPQKPSEAIFRNQPNKSKNALTVSALRDGNPNLLMKRLQGDIDAILLKALRRNPAERYQSTAQFAEDIRNHLHQLPVTAQPDTPAYRVGLFLRRNRALALAATGAATLLIIITVIAVWQAYRARTEHTRAEARFSEVRKMSNALLFDVQDALAPLPGTTPARRLLVAKALEYLSNLAKESTTDRGLQRELAAGYLRVGHLQGNPNFPNLGDTTGAYASYRKARTLLEELHQADAKNEQITNDLAGAHEAVADMLALNGDSAGALEALRRAVALRDEGNAAADSKAASYHNLAVALADAGETREALALSQKAHALAQSLSGADAPRQQALSYSRLAAVQQRSGDRAAAIASYRTALTLYQQLAAADPIAARPKRELSFALEDLASLQPPAEAAPYFLRTLQLRRELAASDPQNMQARRDLAFALLKQGATEDALESFRQLSAVDPMNILARRDLALAWERQGNAHLLENNSAAAKASYESLLRTAREWIQRDPANPYANQMLAAAHLKLAEVLPKLGDTAGAVSGARAAIEIIDGLLAKEKENALFRRDEALAQWVLGRALMESKSWKDALAALEKANALFGEIGKRNQLTREDRAAIPAIAAQIATCRQGQ
ncbi:MAG: serine/threonine protein kinase [Bryobacterales bacterium]|nr:serine/threonine protein kinase [Bryobacterales bacterium]